MRDRVKLREIHAPIGEFIDKRRIHPVPEHLRIVRVLLDDDDDVVVAIRCRESAGARQKNSSSGEDGEWLHDAVKEWTWFGIHPLQ